MKRCTKCAVEKPTEGFYLLRGKPMAECKQCRISAARANALKDHGAYKAKQKTYREAPENGDRIQAAKKRWYASVRGTPQHLARSREVMRGLYARDPQKFIVRTVERCRRFPHLNAENARRHEAAKMRQCPQWTDIVAIRTIYAEAARLTRETGIKHEVDHIVPLRHQRVSGLHVPANLQILTKSQNSAKRNRFEVGSAS